MKKGQGIQQALILAAFCSLALSPGGMAAEPPVSQSLWGYSGLLNIPTAEVLGSQSFYTGLRYFPLNSGLSGVANVSILENLETGLVFGVPPANGFSALAASLKYRIMNQAQGQPLSLAVGATLLGLDERASSYVPGNHAFIALSRGFDWDQTRLLNLHGGFMGGLQGARVFAGLDVPILDLVRLQTEYLGVINGFQALNFGVSIHPHPQFSIELGLMQQPSENFWDRDFTLGVAWRGNWGEWLNPQVSPTPDKPVPSPSPASQPSVQPQPQTRPTGQGKVRLRMLDRDEIMALENVTVTLKQPSQDKVFSGQTDINGEVTFHDIPSGNYEVRAERPGWNPEVRLISVQNQLETFLELALSGQVGVLYGSIEMAANESPQGLSLELLNLAERSVRRLELDGKSYRLENVPPGSYTLVVRQQGEERLRLSILAKGNAESQYDLSLPPAPRTAVPTPQPTSQPSTPGTSSPAQVLAEINGSIKDKQGNLLSGARLELKNDDLLVITLSTPEGKYIFRDIPQGVFRLTLSKEGFKTRIFQLSINKTEVLNHHFEMEPEN